MRAESGVLGKVVLICLAGIAAIAGIVIWLKAPGVVIEGVALIGFVVLAGLLAILLLVLKRPELAAAQGVEVLSATIRTPIWNPVEKNHDLSLRRSDMEQNFTKLLRPEGPVCRCLHIGLSWRDPAEMGRVAIKDDARSAIEEASETKDWLAYGGNCWLVITELSQEDWCHRLKPLLSSSLDLFIYEVANLPESDGRADPHLWVWFRKERLGLLSHR